MPRTVGLVRPLRLGAVLMGELIERIASGYSTVYASPGHGAFARFQPGGGIGMGFDDLKTIEAAEQSAAQGGWIAEEPVPQAAT